MPNGDVNALTGCCKNLLFNCFPSNQFFVMPNGDVNALTGCCKNLYRILSISIAMIQQNIY
jgi:hypothetical protein